MTLLTMIDLPVHNLSLKPTIYCVLWREEFWTLWPYAWRFCRIFEGSIAVAPSDFRWRYTNNEVVKWRDSAWIALLLGDSFQSVPKGKYLNLYYYWLFLTALWKKAKMNNLLSSLYYINILLDMSIPQRSQHY